MSAYKILPYDLWQEVFEALNAAQAFVNFTGCFNSHAEDTKQCDMCDDIEKILRTWEKVKAVP